MSVNHFSLPVSLKLNIDKLGIYSGVYHLCDKGEMFRLMYLVLSSEIHCFKEEAPHNMTPLSLACINRNMRQGPCQGGGARESKPSTMNLLICCPASLRFKACLPMRLGSDTRK